MTLEKFVAIISAVDAQTVMLITAVTAIASIFIAIIALFFSVWQGLQTRKHNKLSVRPLLKFYPRQSDDSQNGHYRLALVNCGIGPAVIKNVKLLFDGVLVPHCDDTDFRDHINHIIREQAVLPKYKTHADIKTLLIIYKIAAISFDESLIAGKEKIIFEFDYNNTALDINVIRKIGLLVEYESFYKEKFPRLEYNKGKFIG